MTEDGLSLDEIELRSWPSQDHDLRARSADDRIYAFLTWQQGRGLQGRLMGFRRAAEILATSMLSNPRNIRDLDTVIFPFAMCWRHYVELQLKSLIKECQELVDRPVTKRGGHNIVQLWSELRPLLVEAIRTRSAAISAS